MCGEGVNNSCRPSRYGEVVNISYRHSMYGEEVNISCRLSMYSVFKNRCQYFLQAYFTMKDKGINISSGLVCMVFLKGGVNISCMPPM